MSAQNLGYEFDEILLHPEIKGKIESFYYSVDDKYQGPDVYTALWAQETPPVLIKNGNKFSDLKSRLMATWDNVHKRKHNIDKIFMPRAHSFEVMVDGQTNYEFQDGKKEFRKWAACFSFIQEQNEPKLTKYVMQSVKWESDDF